MTNGHHCMLWLVAALLLGCHRGETDTVQQEAHDAGLPRPKGEIAQALASAAASAKVENSAEAKEGPPEDGVLPASRADAEIAKGSAPKLTLGSSGREPRVAFSHSPLAGKTPASLQLTLQVGPSQTLPPLTFQLLFEPQKTGKVKSGEQRLAAQIGDVVVEASDVPEDFRHKMSSLSRSRISFTLAPTGAYAFSIEASKATGGEFQDILESISEGISLAMMPTPKEAVGAGAYWMVTSRDPILGIDLVAYRMVRVEKVQNGSADLSFDLRKYAVGRDIDGSALGVTGKLSIQQLNAVTKGEATMALTRTLPTSVEADRTFRALLNSDQQKGQSLIQTGGKCRFTSDR